VSCILFVPFFNFSMFSPTLTPEWSPDLPSLLDNLSSFLSYRYQRRGDLADLNDSIATYKRAAQRGLEVRLEVGLGSASNWLYRAFRREAWAEVVQAYDYAFKASTRLVQTWGVKYGLILLVFFHPIFIPYPQPLSGLGPHRPFPKFHLGLLSRSARNESSNSTPIGVGAFIGPSPSFTWGYSYSTPIGVGAFIGTQNKTRVKNAQAFGNRFNTPVQTQLTRQHQTLWLKELQDFAAYTTYALAQQNQLREAVVTLERGLAQLLSEALARNRADLEQLQQIGRHDLYNRYQQAVTEWHDAQQFGNRLEHPTAEQSEQYVHRLRAAHQQLDDTIAAIRQLEGYADFLAAPGFADISAAVKNTTLIYSNHRSRRLSTDSC
jgi:hypothetical protein